jgi:hypothetical protein
VQTIHASVEGTVRKGVPLEEFLNRDVFPIPAVPRKLHVHLGSYGQGMDYDSLKALE